MNLLEPTKEQKISRIKSTLERGYGHTGKPLSARRIKQMQNALEVLNGEIRESCKSVCGLGVNPYCSDRAKDGTCLHDGYCKHKQTDMERT